MTTTHPGDRHGRMWDPRRRIPQRMLFEAEAQADEKYSHLWGCYERLEAAAWEAVHGADPILARRCLGELLHLTGAARRQGRQ